ncbi:MAG TPA: flagellar biosynthetic protein FliR [candidate division Zixibacteria bacterium]|nr:flagellar biosynthetic protein FliR [candidate division Zixibacteria bacterium]
MFDFLSYGADRLQSFMLVNFRLGGALLMAPIMGRATIPPLVKIGLALTIALLLMPAIAASPLPNIPSLIDLAALGVKELLVGVIIGLVIKLMFYAAQAAGSILGFQSGLAIANIVDPGTQIESNIIGEFWFLITTVVFLALDGHHLVLTGLADSFQLIPLGGAVFGVNAGEMLMRLSGVLFTMALKLAAPILLTVFLVDVALGALARTMPQMNIFVIGIPVKIAVTLLMMAATLPVFSWALGAMSEYLDEHMYKMLGAMASR